MDVPCELLLHPEFLSNEQLISIIQQRQLKINIHHMARDELLDLFHHYCVPYGQRKYRDSGRGRMLNKSRQLSPELKPKLTSMYNGQSRKLSHPNERLKPPPDLLSGHIKRIKLDCKQPYVEKITIKRKMSIDCPPMETIDSTPPKKGKKPITWP